MPRWNLELLRLRRDGVRFDVVLEYCLVRAWVLSGPLFLACHIVFSVDMMFSIERVEERRLCVLGGRHTVLAYLAR